MPPETCSLCHSEIPENSKVCPNCKSDSGTSLETIACTSDLNRLVGSDEDAYWELARHDEDYRTLFGDAKHILNFLPELGDIVNSVFPETATVADIPSFLQKKIDEGDLAFQVDRYGNDIAHLVDRNRRVRHALRLDKKRLTPKMSQAWDNLRTRVMQAEIIGALYDIDRSIAEIRDGLQDDRLALVDDAWSLIEQARAVSDVEYRNDLLRRALDKAAEGRSQLSRSIDRDREELAKQQQDRGGMLFLVGDAMSAIQSRTSLTEKNADCAEQVVRAIAAIESATRAAALVHMHHGEQDAARTTLRQFQNLLRDRHLDNDAAITTLSSFARKDQKPLLAKILSSYTHALEICGVDHKTLLVPSTGDTGVGMPTEDDPADSSVAVPTCDECDREIETGATLCTYHQVKKWEERAGILVVVVPLAVTVVKHRRPIQQGLGAAAKVIRSL